MFLIIRNQIIVAPFTGAWIEMRTPSPGFPEPWTGSLPSRERGLKFLHLQSHPPQTASLPSRERGLKYASKRSVPYHQVVAPFTGAWIEIYGQTTKQYIQLVAPFTGAWIEIRRLGTWYRQVQSLPSRERGLKYFMERHKLKTTASLPSRERGLKLIVYQPKLPNRPVAPFTGAWIEI